eukprot:631016-Prorocentrum_minimum.AAC.2
MAISAANHVSVSHAPPSARHSFQEMTPVTSSAVRPMRAAATDPMPTDCQQASGGESVGGQ